MILRCYAKINLFLRVRGRRSDGFHDLDTLFQEIDWHDELTWLPAQRPLKLRTDHTGLEQTPDTENLVWRAAQAFTQATGLQVGGHVTLHKRIPVGGGLGGGSSNAAAMLSAVNKHFNHPLNQAQLHEVALGLGSDVPFFLQGGCQRAGGRGERLVRHALPSDTPTTGVLILPPFGVPTGPVFGALRPDETGNDLEPQLGENDLLNAAFRVQPQLELLWQLLKPHAQGTFFMSGSGSTLVSLGEAETSKLADEARINGCLVQPFRFLRSRNGT